MSAHLGPLVTAFVDGELDHTRREEVLAHLAHCADCRAEVDGVRSFKLALRCAADASAVPFDLTARLLAATESSPKPVAVAPVRRRPTAHRRLRRTAIGGAFVVLGFGGALSLAGPAPRGPVAPVDPTSPQFVTDHGTTSGEMPFTELTTVSVTRPSR